MPSRFSPFGHHRGSPACAGSWALESLVARCYWQVWAAVWIAWWVCCPEARGEERPLPTPAEALRKLDGIEAEARRVLPQSPLQTRTPNVAILLEDVYQGSTNAYTQDGIRFLALRMLVVNLTGEDRVLDLTPIRLKSGKQSLDWRQRPAGMDGFSFRAGNDFIAIRELQTPESVRLPARGLAAAWLLFAGLEREAVIPPMTLEIPTAAGTLQLDVNLYERAVLQLRVERIGPGNCLALLTIGGELNTINAGALAEELEALAQQGVRRCVLHWDQSAVPPAELLRGWVLQAQHTNAYTFSPQYKHLPTFPVTIHELHLAGVEPTGDAPDQRVHAEVAAAISAALQSVFEVAPTHDVVEAIRLGPAAVRAAALEHGAGRLTRAELPLVLALAEGPEPEVRRAALHALGEFSDPRAIAVLTAACRDTDPALAEAAVRALAASRFPEGPRALAVVLAEGPVLPAQKLVEILAAAPRPEWQDAVYRLTTSSDAKVQQAAIETLARLGHPQLLPTLARALQSEEARVREAAFSQLISLGRRDADELALAYTLSHLERDAPTGNMHQFLLRVRDQRAVPLLLKHLARQSASRESLIQLLAQIGDQDVAAAIAERFADFTDGEKALALDALRRLESPLGRPLALQAVRTDDANLLQNALQTLQVDATDAEVAVLAEVVRSLPAQTHNPKITLLCNGLGAIGTPAARQALGELRHSPQEQVRTAAQKGLEVLWNQSPARDVVNAVILKLDLAERRELRLKTLEADLALLGDRPEAEQLRRNVQQLRDDLQRELQEVERTLQLAIRLDPEYPRLFLARGLLRILNRDVPGAIEDLRTAIAMNDSDPDAHRMLGDLWFRQERFEEALQPLQRAFELNPAAHEALTSRAIALVRLGRLEEGVDLVRGQLAKYRQQAVFLYNVACVYGRAIEQLETVRKVPADDPRIAAFGREAVQLLRESVQSGLQEATGDPDILAFMRSDPDLFSLHRLSEFRRLSEMDRPREPLPPALPERPE